MLKKRFSFICLLTLCLIALASTAVMPLAAQNSKNKAQAAKVSAPHESPEHAFARINLAKSKEQFAFLQKVSDCLKIMNGLESSGAKPTEQEAVTLETCEVLNGTPFVEVVHGLCKSFRGTPDCKTYELAVDVAKADLALIEKNILLEAALEEVDGCARLYRGTIDKKVSDLTTRETDRIKGCKAADLYPPPSK